MHQVYQYTPDKGYFIIYLASYSLTALTLQVARLRQAIEAGGLFGRFPSSYRSTRGGSTADFVSAQGDNVQSDDEFFDPK